MIIGAFPNDPLPSLPPKGKEWQQFYCETIISPFGEIRKGVIKIRRLTVKILEK
jgi:hypothetical protein